MIRRRAITIARTEVIDSLSAGVEQAWTQAQGKGLLGKNAKKEWMTTPFGACNICRALNGQAVALHANFESVLGPLSRPTAHPNCRCGLAPVPGSGGALQPAALPPGVTQATSIPLTADGQFIRGADARKAILKHVESGEAVKQQKLITAAQQQLDTRGLKLKEEIYSKQIDSKVLNDGIKRDFDDLRIQKWKAQRAGDDAEAMRIQTQIQLREARYTVEYKKLKADFNALEKELDALTKAYEEAVSVQSDEILETFIYNKTKNEMVETSTTVKLTKADKLELERGIEAFRRMIDDGIYTTTIEGGPTEALIVAQQTKAHVEFIKHLEGRLKSRSRGKRAFAYPDRDRAYRVKLNFKERSRSGRATTVHELTHTVEYADPGVLAEAIRWRDSLTTDDTLEWLGKLLNNSTYGVDEVGYGDGAAFKSKYIGKVYSEGKNISKVKQTGTTNQVFTARDGWQGSTEVSTVGMQVMYQDPVAFAREMPELFDFVYERIIRRKYTGTTSRYVLRAGDDFKLVNNPAHLTPEAKKRIELAYKMQALIEKLPSTGRPGQFAQRLYELK